MDAFISIFSLGKEDDMTMIEHKDACANCVIFINITSISIDIFERSFLSKHMADTSKNNLTTSMVESFRFKHLFAEVMDG